MNKATANKTRKLSWQQKRLIDYLKPTGDAWTIVPPATRSGTILSLVRAGLIEHKRDPVRGHCTDSVTWGHIRLKPEHRITLEARLADALETAIVIAERNFYPGHKLVEQWQEMIKEAKT